MASLLCSCKSSTPTPPPAYGPVGYAPPGYGPQSYPVPHYGQPPPAHAPHGQTGPAVTPWGVLQQLPPLPSLGQLLAQPLPDLTQWWGNQWGQTPQGAPQTPPPPPPPGQTSKAPPPSVQSPASSVEQHVLTLTNEARARGARCGDQTFPPAAPLAFHPQLHAAARSHSQDMSARNYFSHRTPEGLGPSERARAAGYPSNFVAENIAQGQRSSVEVVEDWLESPGHCANLMDPRYTYLGAGEHNLYWTQKFGR